MLKGKCKIEFDISVDVNSNYGSKIKESELKKKLIEIVESHFNDFNDIENLKVSINRIKLN